MKKCCLLFIVAVAILMVACASRSIGTQATTQPPAQPPSAPSVKQGMKRNLAVYGFEDKTDHKVNWYSGQNIGDGMSDMLTTALVQSGRFRIFERSQLTSVMQEQGLGQSGAMVEKTAAQAGKLLGAEMIVMGSVTEFGTKKSEGGTRLGQVTIGTQTLSATVAVDVRLVDAQSGEIKWSGTVRKEETKTGLSLGTPKFAFKDRKDFDESLIGKAARAAIDETVQKLIQQVGVVPWQALVAAVTDSNVIINQGAESGLRADMVMSVFRVGEPVTDPSSGEVLYSQEEKVGKIKVVDANLGNGKAAKCAIVEGSGFQRGDVVRFEQ